MKNPGFEAFQISYKKFTVNVSDEVVKRKPAVRADGDMSRFST